VRTGVSRARPNSARVGGAVKVESVPAVRNQSSEAVCASLSMPSPTPVLPYQYASAYRE